MGTHTRTTAQWVAGWVAGFAAPATVLTLSWVPATAAPNPPPTLTRDANNPCRVRIIEYDTNKRPTDSTVSYSSAINLAEIAKPLKSKSSEDPLERLTIHPNHAELVQAQVNNYAKEHGAEIQTEIHRVVPNISDPEEDDFAKFRSLAKAPPSIVNFSWGAFYPDEKDWSGFIKNFDPNYAGKGSFEDARKYQEPLLKLLTEPREDNRFRPESEKWLKNTYAILKEFNQTGNPIIRSAGNNGVTYLPDGTIKKTYSPLSLPPYVNSVMALEANGKPSNITSQGTHAEIASVTITAIDAKGTSAILSNGLVLPIQKSIASPDGRSVSYQPIEKPLPHDVQSRLVGANLFPEGSQTSMAAPILSAKASLACQAIRSENPNMSAEHLLQETARQVLMRSNGR
jgi:hypothetical protein